MGARLDGWRTTTRRLQDGIVETEQSAVAARAVVPETEDGAAELARCYWRALERVTVAARVVGIPDRVRVRILTFGPTLLRFAVPEVQIRDGHVGVRYPIAGGLLARRAGGAITFAQDRVEAGWQIRSTVDGFRPMLPGPLYWQIQRRVHVAVGRRYLRTLLA